ncbi:MAG: GspH/FimT family pseudopilin [Kangiellaceae bacterium]|nr:GspH/FimT family pseudopilin [Kangiellaceae bacterium]
MNKNLAFNGFTLLELLFAIAMVGILAALALPAFDGSVSRARITSNTNQMVGAINLARAEAVDRGVIVAVRPVTGGWEVVADPSGTAEQIRIFQPSSNNVNITTTPSSLAGIFFNSNGFRQTSATNTATPSAANLLMNDTEDTSIQRRVCVSISGSVTTTDGGSC